MICRVAHNNSEGFELVQPVLRYTPIFETFSLLRIYILLGGFYVSLYAYVWLIEIRIRVYF